MHTVDGWSEVELTASDEDFVCSVFISELRSVTLARFLEAIVNGCDGMDGEKHLDGPCGQTTHKFDGHLLVVQQIGSLEDDTK